VNEQDGPSVGFEGHRDHLRAIAFRMLGSASEADDAVQEAWLRLAGVDNAGVENLGAWLTTVVSRVCLDMLRARRSRREDLVGQWVAADSGATGQVSEPEEEAVLIDSVGRALLVVLDRLGSAERIAFVLHDMFGVPFDEIASIMERSSVATKKLASRARHRVRGPTDVDAAELSIQRQTIERFLAASRAGDLDAILALLAPDVVRHADRAALGPGRATTVRGARAVADEIVIFGANARFADVALVGGVPGILVAPRGTLRLVVTFTTARDQILEYELIADPSRLRQLELAVLED